MSLEAMLEAEKRGLLSPEKQSALNEARRRGILKDSSSQQSQNSGLAEFEKLARGGLPTGPGTIPDTSGPVPEDNSFQEAGETFKKGFKGYLGGAQIPYVSPALIAGAGMVTDDIIGQYDRGLSGETISPIQRIGEMIDSFKGHYNMADKRIEDWKSEGEFGAVLGRIPRDVALHATGTKVLEAAPYIGTAASQGSKGRELLSAFGRDGVAYAGVSQLNDPDITRAPTDALMGTGLSAVSSAVSPIAKIVSDKISNVGSRLYNSALKTPKKELLAGKNLGEEIFEMRWSPLGKTNRGLKKMAAKGIEKNESAIQKLLNEVPDQTINENIVRNEMLKSRNSLDVVPGKMQAVGSKAKMDQIDDYIKEAFPDEVGSLTLPEANQLKRNMYSTINDNAFYKDQLENPVRTMIQKSQARGLKKAIEDVVPEAKGLNQKLSTNVRLKKATEAIEAANQTKQPVTMYDILGTGLGGSIGGSALGVEGGLAGSVAGYLLPKVLNSTYGKTQVAQGLKGLSSLIRNAPNNARMIGIGTQEEGVPFKGALTPEQEQILLDFLKSRSSQ